MANVKTIVARFKNTGVAAGKPNTLKQFKMPMANAASETKKRYGKIIRFNSTAWMPAMFLPANRRTTVGEKTIPRTVMTAATSASVQKSLLANSQSSFLDFSLMQLENTGMNEAVMDPSA